SRSRALIEHSFLHACGCFRSGEFRARGVLGVGDDGVMRERVLANLIEEGVSLAPGLRCEIEGNEHAAYLGLDSLVIRIDTRELSVVEHTTNEVRNIAVDARGDLLVLARHCVRRLQTDSPREDELACGPAND
ncbi:MAG TPA: hypothetical protein VF403_15710, partial [Kofleriaceae bacterium]